MTIQLIKTTSVLLFFLTSTLKAEPVKVKLAEVIKHQSKYLTLKNKLNVYLISNPKTKVSSASLSMVLGQGDSPTDYPGLPHVLEHALFLGSKNYPQQDEWDKFFRPKGWSNGSTRPDISRYHFQVGSKSFQGGLVRLHDLLFNPSLTENAFKKALQDVEDEYHTKNTPWRKLLSVMRANINPKHPLSTFGTGNYDSFGRYTKDMHEELLKLYNRYYHPENMTLVVYHSGSLTQLEKMVRLSFEKTLSKFTALRATPPPLLISSQLESIIKVNTKGSKPSLDLRFEIPPRTSNINYILPEYLSEYLSETIARSLKSNGYINNLSIAFQGDMYTGILDIYVELTPMGNENHVDVIEKILASLSNFQYGIQNLDNQRKYCLALTEDDAVRLQEIGDWLSDISDQMKRWDTDQYAKINYCPTNISHESIALFTSYLTKEHMQTFHVTNEKVLANEESKFYKVPFSSHKLIFSSE